MDFSRFPLAARATLARRSAAYSLLLSGALLLTPAAARSQSALPTAPTAPTANPALPAPPQAPDIGILLLAIDELPAPGAINALPPAPAATLPGGVDAPPAAITPARLFPGTRPSWFALAQKKKKVDKDADLFRLEPEFTRPTLPRKMPDAVPAPNALPAPVAPAFAVPTEPLGRAHAAAIPLRRALLNFGWSDVSLVTPGAALLGDALASRRLTPRALDALKNALADINAPGATLSPASVALATQAATRIGQALGYRAVVAFYVAPATTQNGVQNAAFSILVADSARENGEPILFDEKGQNNDALRDAGASTAAALLDKTLRTWPQTSAPERLGFAAKHLDNAKALLAARDTLNAQDELNQAIALDNSKSEPLILLGDLLAPTDATGAAGAYRRAVELNARDGETLAKIAIAYSGGNFPDWPRALDSGRKAIDAGFDSVPLRVALASAQYGRADLFRKADRQSQAEDAEIEARTHLDRALELAPDDPLAVRLLARRLVESRRFNEAIQTLDRVAPRYPTDLEIQTQYAAALGGQIGREEDAFVAMSRVWKLAGLKSVSVDALKYRTLAQGFDMRLYNIGKSAVQLTTGVANAALPREDALIQLTRLKEDMALADSAINTLRVPASVGFEGVAARQFASTLMTQALEQQQIYLETGQSLARLRGSQLYTQAVAQLNAARGGR